MKPYGFLFALVLVGSLRIAATWQHFNATYDEPFHVACGVQWWAEKEYTRERQHPPLARILVGLGPYLAGVRPGGRGDSVAEGNFLLHERGHYWRHLTLARAGTLPFFWLGCAAIWLLGRRLYGPNVGVAAVGVFSLLPPVLGHAGLATTDLAAMATFAWTVERAQAWMVSPARMGVFWTGLALGLAMAAKFSNLLVVALAVGLLVVAYRRGWPLVLSVLLGLVVLSSTYRFVKEFPDGQKPKIALQSYLYPAWQGIEAIQKHNRDGHFSLLLGQVHVGGDWRFFPVALAVKTPLAALALFLLAWRRAAWLPVAMLLLLLAALLPVNINLGIRHALHLYVPLSLAAGWALIHASRWLTVPLSAWLVVASALAHPDYIASFNEAARPEPSWFLAESDLDWGQDLAPLVRMMDRRGIATCRLTYFGTADLSQLYPGRFRDVPRWEETSKGCVAVSVRILALTSRDAVRNGEGDPWHWIRQVPELERAGKSIVVYDVP